MDYIFERKIEDKNLTSGFRMETEKIELERWSWGVVYKDKTELKQFDVNGRFHQFCEIDANKVAMFVMFNTQDANKRIDLICKGNVQYFHFYRNLFLEDGQIRHKIYVFGWKNKDTGICSYNYILPDDRLITADHDIENLLAFNL